MTRIHRRNERPLAIGRVAMGGPVQSIMSSSQERFSAQRAFDDKHTNEGSKTEMNLTEKFGLSYTIGELKTILLNGVVEHSNIFTLSPALEEF